MGIDTDLLPLPGMHMPSKAKTPHHPTKPRTKTQTETRVIPVVEETVSVSHEVEKTGKALRVRIVSREEEARIPVTEAVEELTVRHVPINRYVTERSGPREEGDVVIIPVFESVVVVEERLLLKEEVHILRQRREVKHEKTVVLRKDTAVVERRASGQDEWSEAPPDQP